MPPGENGNMKFTHTVKHWNAEGLKMKLSIAVNCESEKEARNELQRIANFEAERGCEISWTGQKSFSIFDEKGRVAGCAKMFEL